jgi:cytochrome c
MLLTSKSLGAKSSGLAAALVCCFCMIAPHTVGAQSASPSSVAPPALSIEAGLELARKKNCLGCHQLDSKRVGPSFQAVAQRHNAQPGSLDYLAGAIRQGGRGRWGAVPMPVQPHVNQQDALQLAQWIITLR